MWGSKTRTLAFVALGQVGWFAAVLSAARGWIWAGPAVVAALLALAALAIPHGARGRWLTAVALLGLAGSLAESLLAATGLVHFAAGLQPWLAPPWIAALWCLAALWLPSLEALAHRPVIAALLGAVGGPAAYAGGARLGAATFPSPSWPSLLAIAVVWGVALPVMLRVPALVSPRGMTGKAAAPVRGAEVPS